MIKFTVLGIPQAQGRPRAGKTRTGKTVLYDPAKSRDYKQYVRLVASQHAPRNPIEHPVSVFIDVYRQIPSSMSKKRRRLANAKIYRPITKSDIDNYSKSILDSLNGILWKDDAQVVSLTANKYYSDEPRIEVAVQILEEGRDKD
ncbi:RusA family crossover junction endodeoxyribonuclease [Terrihalobacillus insolitus]|uniref:RusA family crossover junction endodeoxyribonuclease n=1 Tax=Terrihalobacillus insolitus TaxID=2950438 RepID=UPI00233FBC1E|nr:RusA family crossover junction endodeoxyribonuclease [Terrihalobacillus insolitus]MDC3414289.1 RusA family crossover junction endodeoxyribonuclease [Terrihalobacillus insolitus]